MTTTAAEATRVARARWHVPALLALVAIVLRLGALFARRHLDLDDGAYGLSVIGMRHGLAPYRDLFSSQGPLHYPLLDAGDVLGLHMRNAPRVVPVLSGALSAIGVWAASRRLGSSRRVAFVSGVLVAATGSMLWTTGPVSSDGPAVAFTVCAVWAALVFRDRPAAWRAAFAGALLGAALATKPLMFPAVLPIAWWCWQRRRAGDVLTTAGTAIAVWFAAALPWGVSRVWEQSVRFHLDKHAEGSPVSRLGKLASTLFGRDLLLVTAVLLGLVAAYALHRRLSAVRHADVVVIGVWLGAMTLVLVTQKLLLASHMVMLVPPLALLFAARPAPLRWLAIALVVIVPVQLYQLSDILWPPRYHGSEARAVAILRDLPPGALAIADITGLVWQSGRQSPPFFNDDSQARIATGRLTTRDGRRRRRPTRHVRGRDLVVPVQRQPPRPARRATRCRVRTGAR